MLECRLWIQGIFYNDNCLFYFRLKLYVLFLNSRNETKRKEPVEKRPRLVSRYESPHSTGSVRVGSFRDSELQPTSCPELCRTPRSYPRVCIWWTWNQRTFVTNSSIHTYIYFTEGSNFWIISGTLSEDRIRKTTQIFVEL